MTKIMTTQSLLLSSALVGGLFVAGTATPAHAQTELPELRVEAPAMSFYPGNQDVSPQDMEGAMSHDAGHFLGHLPGISAARMGGHGLEPVIRGQQQGQLNIILDGAFIYGGCPNRMDPPASFASTETYDSITVLQGYQSVQYGPGGTGGTVLFERTPRNYETEEVQWNLFFDTGIQSNGSVFSALGDITAGTKDVEVRSVISASRGENYTDGDGESVRSAFDTRSFLFSPTWHVSENTDITVGLEVGETEDALFEGAGMDAPEDLSVTYRAKLDHEWNDGLVRGIKVEAYQTLVNHVMDNFSLRTNTGMKMKTKADSDTFGGKIALDIDVSGDNAFPLMLGLDYQSNNRDAKRYSGMAAAADTSTAQAYLWPDATIAQTGVFAEKIFSVASATRLKIGGRYDYVRADADAADQDFDGTRSANDLYQMYYADDANDQTEHNLGALARLEYDLSDEAVLFAGVSRSMRTADTTERYMASWSGVAASRWVGNPDIDPEAHHQIDLGLMLDKPLWHMNASVYYDDVDDFIMRDLARGQDGIVLSDSATIYRNIDATLSGFILDGHYDVAQDWVLAGNMAYTYGENDEDDDALAQIPPLEGQVSLLYAPEKWSLGARANWALEQNRIDDDTSQRDAQETPGYVTLDLYGTYDLTSGARLHVGVDNIFDEDYASHLNRSSSFDPTEVQVNEPGRSFYMRLSARF